MAIDPRNQVAQFGSTDFGHPRTAFPLAKQISAVDTGVAMKEPLSPDLPWINLYGLFLGTAGYDVRSTINFYLNGSLVAEVPFHHKAVASLAGEDFYTSALLSGDVPIMNGIMITARAGGNGIQKILTPHRLYCHADTVTWHLTKRVGSYTGLSIVIRQSNAP